MLPLFRQALSRETLSTLVKTGKGLDYNKALNNVTALYRSAVGATANDVLVPLPSTEKPRIKPEELTDVQIEEALSPLFDYFDANLPTLNTALSETTRDMVMTRIWKEILAVIEGLLIPPLSDAPSNMKPLSDKEVDIVFKWLKVPLSWFDNDTPTDYTGWRSSFGITFTLVAKAQCLPRRFRTRSSEMSCPFVSTTTGTRTRSSRGLAIREAN